MEHCDKIYDTESLLYLYPTVLKGAFKNCLILFRDDNDKSTCGQMVNSFGILQLVDRICWQYYHDEPILCFNHHPSKVVPEIVLNCVELWQSWEIAKRCHLAVCNLSFGISDKIYHDESLLCFSHSPSKMVSAFVFNSVEFWQSWK